MESQGQRRAFTKRFLFANGLVIAGALTLVALSGVSLWLTGLGVIALGVQALYVQSSFEQLNESDIALVCVFGSPVYVVSDERRFLAPALVSTLWLFPRDPLTATVVCADVITSEPIPREARKPTFSESGAENAVPAVRVIVTVTAEVTFQVIPESLNLFVRTFGSIEHARRILESAVLSGVYAEFARRTIRECMRNATSICATLTDRFHTGPERYFQEGGVNVIVLRIVKIDFGQVTQAMESVDEAMFHLARQYPGIKE